MKLTDKSMRRSRYRWFILVRRQQAEGGEPAIGDLKEDGFGTERHRRGSSDFVSTWVCVIVFAEGGAARLASLAAQSTTYYVFPECDALIQRSSQPVRAWNEFNYLLAALVKHRPSISLTTNSACCAGGKKRGMQGGFERSGEPGLNECMERLSVEPSASHRDYGKVEIEVAQQYRPGIQGESSGVAARRSRPPPALARPCCGIASYGTGLATWRTNLKRGGSSTPVLPLAYCAGGERMGTWWRIQRAPRWAGRRAERKYRGLDRGRYEQEKKGGNQARGTHDDIDSSFVLAQQKLPLRPALT
ncbi:hypothetical protein B0H14DRAFT_3632147 [Mycena olivaceomarginata]|nr:hypothetical protein B0H14DRAFT_3632147 [Mycena olivaceomarginata]